MKTAYLIKSEPKLVNFNCDDKLGLSFTTSFVDITYLNNIGINGDLRLFVQQNVGKIGTQQPTVWFLLLTDKPMTNANFEDAWRYVVQVGSILQKYAQMGLSFSYQNAWTYPNIPDEWVLNEMLVEFSDSGGVKGIYWDDPSQPTYEENGQTLRMTTLKEIKADFVTIIGSEKLLRQAHTTHLTVPGKNINVNAGVFYRNPDVLESIAKNGLHAASQEHLYLQVLYNKAISTADIFLSFSVLYQMIEVVTSLSKPTSFGDRELQKILDFVEGDATLVNLKDRISGSLKQIKKETSFELFQLGLEAILGPEHGVDHSPKLFREWRKFRGKLTHPKELQTITEESFVENYQTLRAFWDAAMTVMHVQTDQS